MTISEKVAYLKGLCEGMKLDTEKNEGKLISAVIDILSDMAEEIDELNEVTIDLTEELEDIYDAQALLEDVVFQENDYDDDDEEEDCCCCYDDDDEEPLFFEVRCPSCSNEITIDEDVLELGSISCPNCGEKLEFDLDFDDDEDDEEDEV
jgi:hypothetical protein